MLADFTAIVAAAKRIPAEVDPPDRVWVSLRAQLEAEGIIRDSRPVVAPRPLLPWWTNIAQSFRFRTLATVGAGLFLVLGSVYLLNTAAPSLPQESLDLLRRKSARLHRNPLPANLPCRRSPVLVPRIFHGKLSPPVSLRFRSPGPLPPFLALAFRGCLPGDSAALLSQTEDALPSRELASNPAVDASLRQNLRTLNEFIAECEAHLKQHPQDQLAREYLNSAYQQKAELLAAMMDSGRSEH